MQLKAGESRRFTFERPAEDLKAGTHQVEVKLASTDALPFDDVRYATVEVRAGRKVLVIADNPKRDARIWRLALDTAKAFRCDTLPTDQAGKLEPKELLAKYKAVCLIDVDRPNAELWAMLEAYVEDWPVPGLYHTRYMLRSGMMGWLTLLLNPSKWSSEVRQSVRAELDRLS